jgi:hypothetical protein
MTDLQLEPNISSLLFKIMSQIDLLFFEEDNIHFVYAPALDVTGYGLNEQEAQNSFVISLEEFLDFTQKKGTLNSELERMGWKLNRKTNHFDPPFLDEILKKNKYLSDIIRKHEFQKRSLMVTNG